MGVDVNKMRDRGEAQKGTRASGSYVPARRLTALEKELALHRWAVAELSKVLHFSQGAHEEDCLGEKKGGGCTCRVGRIIRAVRKKLRGS